MKKDIITRVAAIADTIQVKLMNVEKNSKYVADIFKCVSDEGVNIDMISSVILEDEMRIDFTCDGSDQKKLNHAIAKIKEKHPRIVIYVTKSVGKLIIEGNMKEEIGIASEIFGILGEAMIPFTQVTTSETSISFVVEKDHLQTAYNKLKEELI